MGKGKSQTIGYKYMVGAHMVACHGPIDMVTRLTVDDRLAWTGVGSGGPITVAAEKLFGGDEREGGVSGTIDIEMGLLTQPKNDYLLAKIGEAIPAYRGVVGLVFRQCYMGNNPYLKPWRLRGQRVYLRENGIPQWYPAKAGVTGNTTEGIYRYVRINVYSNNGGSNAGIGELQIAQYAGGPNLVQGVAASATSEDVLFGMFASKAVDGDATFTRNWVALSTAFPQSLTLDMGPVNRITPAELRIAPAYKEPTWGLKHFDIEASVDGVTWTLLDTYNDITDWTYTYHTFTVGPGNVDGLDLNPAHIIRECLTNPDWGMGYSEDDVDDVAFAAAADTLFAEGMGMSLLWDKQTTLEAFISDVVRHIDAALFVARSTGKFVLKLTRADYDPATLIHLDESNIDKIDSPSRPAFGELANSVTVNYWNSRTGRQDSLSVQDPAGVQMQGAVINTTLQYPGFTNGVTAVHAAARDLRALSNPFLTCTVYTGEIARDLEIGDCFKLSWSKWRIAETVMRVTGFAMSDGRNSQVRINCVEDVFSTPLNAVQAPPNDGWVDPSGPPEIPAITDAFEAPYYEITQVQGQSATDAALATDPALGYVAAAAVRGGPRALSGALYTDAGAGYARAGGLDLCPGGFLSADIAATTTAVTLTGFEDLDLAEVGQHCQLGLAPNEELCRIDAIDPIAGILTIGRGVLDTVPRSHSAGTPVLIWDNYSGRDLTEYASGETVNAKVVTVSGSGELLLGAAAEIPVLLVGRAFRPYAPGDLKINGDSYLTSSAYSGALAVTWVPRDRTQQTAGTLLDHFDPGVGPEAGTTYRVRTYLDGALISTDEPAASGVVVTPPADGLVRIEVHTKRDGLYSYQPAFHEFFYIGTSSRGVETGEWLYTETGDLRITEN